MSVYTPLTASQITDLCAQFSVNMAAFKPIQNGVENSNWFITATDDREYVLTLFEERSATEVATLARLMLALDAAGLPVAAPLPLNDETGHISSHAGKAVQLLPRIAGQHPESASVSMCTHMGKTLAQLHASLAKLTPASDYTLAQYPWQRSYEQHLPQLNAADKQLMQGIWQHYSDSLSEQNDMPTGLPKGLTHGDLFLDNTLWQEEELSGLLDFTEVCEDDLLMDIAITANDCCTNWQTMHFDDDKLAAFVRGYAQVRALTEVEQDNLRLFLAMAALRFWLLRLDIAAQNAEKNRTGDDVLVKSPRLMRDLAAMHAAQLGFPS